MNHSIAHSHRHLAIDELDRAIVNLAGRINAATYELLVLIRRFDERAGWLKWGFPNCADWLHWRCDLSMNAAREKVRVAHALKTLPEIAVAFSEGRLSYSKVRALVRAANRDNEEELLAFALRTTASRVEERCRELRFGIDDSVAEARLSHARRALRIHRYPDRGTITITVDLPLETGELIGRALDKARDDASAHRPEFSGESWQTQQADALVAMATDYLTGHSDSPAGSSENYCVTVHVDRSALVEGKGRSGLPVESVRRISCDADIVTLLEDENGQPLDVGRKTRVVPTAIKRALWARDKGCSFPGCKNTRFVDAHHIEHWSAGGATRLDNLMLLCTRHHRLVHEDGFTVEKDYRDHWFFRRPDGKAVPHSGYHPEDVQDDAAYPVEFACHPHDSAESFMTVPENSPPRPPQAGLP